MVKEKSDTINLLGNVISKEGAAETPINPGHLVAIGSSVRSVKVNDVEKASVRRCFALENYLIGKTKNDEYEVGENVLTGLFYSGCEVNAKVAANAEAIVRGDYLEAAGDGTLRKLTDGVPIGIALEAVDNSGGTGEMFIITEVV